MKAIQDIVLLLAMAALMTPLPATAQEPLPTGAANQQTLSMGQPPQNYGILHVNAVIGSDQQGIGSAEQPYKTITQALRMAPSTSTVILLAPGHYSQETGEQFPLRLRPGITIQGQSGETRNTFIVGGGEVQIGTVTQNAAIVAADRSGLANILVSNAKGSGVWITAGEPVIRRVAFVSNAVAGVQVTNGAPIVENSYFHGNQYGLTLQGNGHALVRGNYFEATGHAITVASPATPTIHNNRIARNRVGIALKNNARPRLDANVLNGNGRNGVVEVEPAPAVASLPDNGPDGEIAVLPETVVDPGTAAGRETGIETGVEIARETGTQIAVKLPTTNQAAVVASPVTVNGPIETTAITTAITTATDSVDDAVSDNQVEMADETAGNAIASPSADLALREALAPRETRETPTISAAPAPITAAESVFPPTPTSQPATAVTSAPSATVTPATVTPAAVTPAIAVRVPTTPTIESRQATLPEPDEVVVSPVVSPTVDDVAVIPAPEDIAPESVALENIVPEDIAPENVALQDVAADGAIAIAVIPASGPELSHNDPVNQDTPATSGRREGISKLLARLNSTLVNEPAPAEDSDNIDDTIGLTTPAVPAVPTADIPATGQRLPVPSAAIPGGGSLNLSPPGSVALAETFRYRVLVDMADAEDLSRLVPDAFRTSVGRRMFMQAGAYIDEAEAQERLEWLQENGIEGRVDLRN